MPQDACLALGLADATLLPQVLQRTATALGALPGLQGFVGGVCEALFRGPGRAFVPAALGAEALGPGAAVQVGGGIGAARVAGSYSS